MKKVKCFSIVACICVILFNITAYANPAYANTDQLLSASFPDQINTAASEITFTCGDLQQGTFGSFMPETHIYSVYLQETRVLLS